MPDTRRSRQLSVQWWPMVLVLLIVAASRLVRLVTLEMDRDEIWTVWQTFGTPGQIVRWTPYDWSPVYYLLVGLWRTLTGISPYTLRSLAVYGFLVGIAVLYRLGKTLFDERTALIAAAACAAMGYATNVSTLLRGYSLLFTLTMLAWWLAIRYFRRPTLWRASSLAMCLALMIYIHITSPFTMIMIGAFTAILYGKRIWRWWLPGFLTMVFAAPELASKLLIGTNRASTGLPVLQAWLSGGAHIFLTALDSLVRDFAGYELTVWTVLLVIAGALILEQHRLERRTLALGLWLLAPVLFFFVQLWDAYTNRHLAWIMPGAALWVGWGLARLPSGGRVGLLLVFSVMMFGPVPVDERYKKVDAPLLAAYTFMAQHAEASDVLYIDPGYHEVMPEEWDYYSRVYFPNGLPIVSATGSNRRIWYVSNGSPDKNAAADVQRNRLVGPGLLSPGFSLRLYEAPPDLDGVAFENGLRFHGAEEPLGNRFAVVRREGEALRVRLWWSVDKPVPLDYSVGVYLIGQGGTLTQNDSAPQVADAPGQTSRWVPGQLYVEEREIQLPEPLKTGEYPLKIAVYFWQDGKRLSAPGVDGDHLLTVLTVKVKSW